MLPQQPRKLHFEFVDGVSENDTRADLVLVVMNQKCRNPQGADRKSCHAVDIVKVIVHIPVYRKVRNHVHLRVVQLSDLRQVYAGPVCLYTVFEHIVHVLQE